MTLAGTLAGINDSWYRATANATPVVPPLHGEVRADVCVVGGGYTGLSAALALAEQGRSVVLLEAGEIGQGASGRNGGQLIAGLRWDASDLADRFGVDDARRLFQLAMTAIDRVRDRVARHGIACDLTNGQFYAAAKPAHYRHMAEERDFLREVMDYESVDLIARDAVPAIVGADCYHGGLFDHHGGHFHPLNYALGLADAAQGAGAALHSHSAATALVPTGDKTRVQTAAGAVLADHVVLGCDTGMGSIRPDLGRYAMAVMNYNIATAPLGAELTHSLIPSNAAISDSRFVLDYYRLTADHRLIFGGGERYSPTPPCDIAGFVRGHMLRVFPQLESVAIDYGWGGAVGVSLNRLPHFGRDGNVFYAHGYSGQGAALTTLAGELMAEAICGTSERFDVFARLRHRPFPGGRLLRNPLYVAGMLYYALKDRL